MRAIPAALNVVTLATIIAMICCEYADECTPILYADHRQTVQRRGGLDCNICGCLKAPNIEDRVQQCEIVQKKFYIVLAH